MIEIALLFAWLLTHAAYRGAVGTYCAVKKIDPPWVKSRQERLTNREVRRADRRAVLESKRTARGFLYRLWGDLWQDANTWLDGVREEKEKRLKENPEGKPVVSVDADQAADWARNLVNKIRRGWARWWAPSRKQCPWLTPVLNDDHTQVVGRACGQPVRMRKTYCPTHEGFAAIGHCLWGNRNDEIPSCMSHRHGHFPYCGPHLEEWGNNVADQEARAAASATPPATPEAAQLGTLDAPDAPALATTAMTDEQRELAAKIKDAWSLGKLVEPDPTYAEWFALPVAVRADLLKAAEDGGIQIDTQFDVDARTHAGLPVGHRKTNQSPDFDPHDYLRELYGPSDDQLAPPSSPTPVAPAETDEERQRRINAEQAARPTCSAPISATSNAVCGIPMHPAPGGWVCYQKHAPEQGPQSAPDTPSTGRMDGTPVPRTFVCTIPITGQDGQQRECGYELGSTGGVPQKCPVPHDLLAELKAEREANNGGDTEDHPQRPALRIVPNDTQGDTNTMTAPAEITNIQSLKTFAEKVKEHGNQEWPAMLENAESQIGAAGLSNDPAITSEIGAMREAAGMFAAAAERLEVALRPHEDAAEQISGLGNRAADKTATYQNQ